MTTMKELEKMDEKALASFIEEKRELVRTYRFGTGGSNVSAVKTAKKDIARALTLAANRAKAAAAPVQK